MEIIRDTIRGYNYNVEDIIYVEVIEKQADRKLEFSWGFKGYDKEYLFGVSTKYKSFEEQIDEFFSNGGIYDAIYNRCRDIVIDSDFKDIEEDIVILAKKYMDLLRG